MTRTRSMSADVRRALDARWPRVRDEARTHLKVMEEFAQSGEGRTAAECKAACRAAHKLSGSLGMFGRRDASSVAAAIEDLLGRDLTAAGWRDLHILVQRLDDMLGRSDSTYAPSAASSTGSTPAK
jgi:HPt (histidine-containing phosphotransfer) domain-containing protein